MLGDLGVFSGPSVFIRLYHGNQAIRIINYLRDTRYRLIMF